MRYKRLRIFFSCILIFLSVFLTSSCSHMYEDVPELTADMVEEMEADLEEFAIPEEDRAKRMARLKEVSEAPYPPYKIDAGDVLQVKVYNNPDLEVTAPVTPDGHIAMMFVGQILVRGLTIPQAVATIQDALSNYIKNPIVGIIPVEVKSQTATIGGAVRETGVYSVHGNVKLADLYAFAGGGAYHLFDGRDVPSYDFAHSYFVRDNEILPVDFTEAIVRGNPAHNIRMQKGDYVHIAASSDQKVTVFGEVFTPCSQLWTDQLSLLQAIAYVGGLKDQHWHHVIIMRGGVAHMRVYRADINSIMLGQKQDIPLKPGDLIFVPKDAMEEYNVYVRKLLPTAQLIDLIFMPFVYWKTFSNDNGN